MTRIARVWEDRIEQDVISESLIRQFCQAIVPLAKGRARVGGKETNMTEEEAADIVADAEMRFENGGYELEERHTAKGFDWLNANGLRAGIPLEPIAGFLYFRWIGARLYGSGYQAHYAPVWEITYEDQLGKRQTYEYSWEPYQQRMYGR